MNEATFVYIIAHRSDAGAARPVKVGITKTLGGRLASLQTGNWREIEIAHYFWLPTREMAAKVERQFHEDMAQFRLSGEWFDVTPFDALETLCSGVFAILEEHYAGADQQIVKDRVGLTANFRIVTDFYGFTSQ